MNQNVMPTASDVIEQIRRSFRNFEHSGCHMDPQAVRSLCENLAVVREISRDQERELEIQLELRRIDLGRDAVRTERLNDRIDRNNASGGNVFRLPLRPRSIVTTPDGGDAA